MGFVTPLDHCAMVLDHFCQASMDIKRIIFGKINICSHRYFFGEGRKSAKNRKNMPKFFCSKSAEMKILLCKVGTGIKLYETNFFDLWSEKIELM